MSTSRHPSYRDAGKSNLIDSTEAARMLRLSPHDPLFRRYDILRAAGRLKPVSLDPVRFNVDDVRALAMLPDPCLDAPADDPLRPARGVMFALLLGAGFLAIIGLNVWWWGFR